MMICLASGLKFQSGGDLLSNNRCLIWIHKEPNYEKAFNVEFYCVIVNIYFAEPVLEIARIVSKKWCTILGGEFA